MQMPPAQPTSRNGSKITDKTPKTSALVKGQGISPMLSPMKKRNNKHMQAMAGEMDKKI